jgi:hypothetical protein
MTTIIDFATRAASITAEKNKPDAKFIAEDRYGVPMFTYQLEYRHNNATHIVHIFAYSETDANARLQAMKAGLVYGGQVVGE